MKNTRYIPVISRKENCKLAVSDICYVYRTNRKLNFETDLGVKSTYVKMDIIERCLGPEFCRCMSGCIVNMSRIKDMRDGIVLFDDGKIIKLGRDAFIKLKQRYKTYLYDLLSRDKTDDPDNDEDE